MLDTYTQRHLHGFLRPLLHGEGGINKGMLYPVTLAPLPQPQVETFEAHGHVWYRHVPGDAQPVESNVDVFVLFDEMDASSSFDYAGAWDWGFYDDFRGNIIGYRFPDFPAVHTTLQQQQPFAHVEKTEQSFQHDTTKQRLLTMYHGWCDVAPDSVAECIADVAKVLYPTDADRCDAAFEDWRKQVLDKSVAYLSHRRAWDAAWNAAKQQKS